MEKRRHVCPLVLDRHQASVARHWRLHTRDVGDGNRKWKEANMWCDYIPRLLCTKDAYDVERYTISVGKFKLEKESPTANRRVVVLQVGMEHITPSSTDDRCGFRDVSDAF